jgi:ABC-2 type transport system ATP-binding protein
VTTELLRVEHLGRRIARTDILTDVSFDIRANEILGLIGPNGAGKTTLLECLAGLQPRAAGTFYVDGDAPAEWDPRDLLFYLPNGISPFGELASIDVLKLYGELYDVEPRRWEKVIVDDLSLGEVLHKRMNTLSKGNVQRVLLALALLTPRPLLALDEPFDGLDLHQTQAMMTILREVRRQSRTLLLCIHQLADAERICDRFLLLSAGRLVGSGTLDDLRALTRLPGASLEEVFLALT